MAKCGGPGLPDKGYTDYILASESSFKSSNATAFVQTPCKCANPTAVDTPFLSMIACTDISDLAAVPGEQFNQPFTQISVLRRPLRVQFPVV
jgi:hypothetical protein